MIQKKTTINLGIIISIFLPFSIILNGYSSGISSLSLAMFCFVLLTILSLLNFSTLKVSLKTLQIFSLVFFIYILFDTLILSFLMGENCNWRSVFFSLLRFSAWGYSAIFLGNNIIDYPTMNKWINRIAIASIIYILIQSIFFYLFKVVIPSTPTFGLLKQQYNIYENSQVTRHGFRPSAFFSEPAYLAFFLLLKLVIELYMVSKDKKRNIMITFIILALLFSTSSIGIYMGAIILSFYFSENISRKSRIIPYVCFCLLVTFGLFVISDIDWGEIRKTGPIGNALGYSMSKLITLSQSGRVGKSFAYLKFLSGNEWLYGVGLGNEAKIILGSNAYSVYMNSLTSLIFTSGIIGVILFLLFIIRIILYSRNKVVKLLCFVYVVSGLFSGLYFSLYGILYISTILSLLKQERLIRKYDEIK